MMKKCAVDYGRSAVDDYPQGLLLILNYR